MDGVLKGETSTLFLILYLLPGFLGAVVYNYLVERQSPSNFDKVVEALVLTLVASVVAHLVFGIALLPDIAIAKDASLSQILNAFVTINLLYISICAAVISVLLAAVNNHNVLYKILT